ncbi:MAG TPA: DUF1203 domain-containing protein [Candidatus Udaeobacter sp.]|jgi:hypothetical protein|nr:DUF1203 domain-containing protein [Candidatus Udaeobacter sp.]
MKSSKFRVVPLATEVADEARRKAKNRAPDHKVVTADSPNSYPCRHCLRWAEPGERVVLFPYASIPAGHAYSEMGPIFVHEQACERYAATEEYPAAFRTGRSIRAYDSDHNIIAAEVANGSEPEAIIEKFLETPETAFVHVRSASHGCYTMEIQRR